MPILLTLVFVLSGAAGLIYESIWTRYLGLFVGHGAYAQIIVLTIFLGGMSAGAFVVSRVSEKLRDPLAAYAFVELAIGMIGFVFHDMFVATTNARVRPSLSRRSPARRTLVVIVKWTIAALLILPQSILLGATFPLMSAGVLRIVPRHPGRVLAQLYFANSIGGAAGVLIAGFWLLNVGGLPLTLDVAAIVNLVVFLIALGVARFGSRSRSRARDSGARGRVAPKGDVARGRANSDRHRAPASDRRLRHSDRIVHLRDLVDPDALAPPGQRDALVRADALRIHSRARARRAMDSSRADSFADPVRALGIVQCVMGLAALATHSRLPRGISVDRVADHGAQAERRRLRPVHDRAVLRVYRRDAPVHLLRGHDASAHHADAHAPRRRRARDRQRVRREHARLDHRRRIAGLILLPLVGLKALLIEGAVLDMALGVVLLRISGPSVQRRQQLAYVAAVGMTIAALASIVFNRFDQVVLSSGVYRYGSLPDSTGRQIIFYRDGRTATVAVGRSLPDSFTWIATNGKPDASVDRAWFSARDTSKRAC